MNPRRESRSAGPGRGTVGVSAGVAPDSNLVHAERIEDSEQGGVFRTKHSPAVLPRQDVRHFEAKSAEIGGYLPAGLADPNRHRDRFGWGLHRSSARRMQAQSGASKFRTRRRGFRIGRNSKQAARPIPTPPGGYRNPSGAPPSGALVRAGSTLDRRPGTRVSSPTRVSPARRSGSSRPPVDRRRRHLARLLIDAQIRFGRCERADKGDRASEGQTRHLGKLTAPLVVPRDDGIRPFPAEPGLELRRMGRPENERRDNGPLERN